jgi:hypothetical protein
MKILQGFGDPKWSGGILIPQDSNHTEGELLSITSADHNLSGYNIRVQDMDVDVFKTKLNVKEDDNSVLVN